MTLEQIKIMRDRVQHLCTYLRIDEKQAQINSDKQLTLAAGFWDDNTRATKIVKDINIRQTTFSTFGNVLLIRNGIQFSPIIIPMYIVNHVYKIHFFLFIYDYFVHQYICHHYSV